MIYDRDGTITTFLDGGQWGPRRTGKDYYRLHLHPCHGNYFGDLNYYAIMQNTRPFKEYCDDYNIYNIYGQIHYDYYKNITAEGLGRRTQSSRFTGHSL